MGGGGGRSLWSKFKAVMPFSKSKCAYALGSDLKP